MTRFWLLSILAVAACGSSGDASESHDETSRGARGAGDRHEEPARDEPGRSSGGGTSSAREPGASGGTSGSSGGSGVATAALPVEGSRAMATLSEAELTAVCGWLVENAPHRRVECEDGPTFEVGVSRDHGCPPATAFAGCTLTVGQATSCIAENAHDPCAHGMFGATVCAPFRECMLLQMGAVREGPAEPTP